MSISKKAFATTPDDQQVDIYTLSNTNGLKAEIITYGGTIKSLYVPDKNGNLADIVLGYDNLDEYINGNTYFGCIIGRYGNRIANGKFTLDDTEYTLATNDGPHHLHGGIKGFDKVVWNAKVIDAGGSEALKLTYTSPDGEEGYPGNLTCTVTYTLTNANELKIQYHATTDKATLINMTNHSYFNLAGFDSGDILSHELEMTADNYLPADETLMPTGEIKSVKETPMDFTKQSVIGSRIAQAGGDPVGYDHCYVLNSPDGSLTKAACVYEPNTGRIMNVYTTEPGMQFYTGNFLDGSSKGKGVTYNKHAGLCLETQHYPNSPNMESFPSAVLRPGETYSTTTVHEFTLKR